MCIGIKAISRRLLQPQWRCHAQSYNSQCSRRYMAYVTSLTVAKKDALTYLNFSFPVPVYRDDLTYRTFLFGRMGMWGSRRSLCFSADLDLYFCDCDDTQLCQIYNYSYLRNYNDNRETTKQTRTFWGVVGIFVHAQIYDLDLVKVGESGLT